MCVGWAVLDDTRAALDNAVAAGTMSDLDLARLEVVAAAAVQRAVLEFAGQLFEVSTPEVAAERSDVIDRIIGPLSARAGRAVVLLEESGARQPQQAWLTQVWLNALAAGDSQSAGPQVGDLGDELGGLVDDVASEFADELPSWADDPALDVSSVAIPATLGLIAERCPDVPSA
jgi:hypothetical protein